MEIPVVKRRGKCRRKRLLKKRMREQMKREVKFARRRMDSSWYVTDACETLTTGTMQAEAFWKNYAVAQEWQKRHSITWWRSRCVALEHENEVLRDKVRSLAQSRDYRDPRVDDCQENGDDETQEGNYAECGTNNDDLEFNVTEDVLNFFETSERHKRKMRHKQEMRKREDRTTCENENSEETPFIGVTDSVQQRKEEAELLYGDASSKILAMETALQCMIERHEDTANPQYWPNIPLRP